MAISYEDTKDMTPQNILFPRSFSLNRRKRTSLLSYRPYMTISSIWPSSQGRELPIRHLRHWSYKGVAGPWRHSTLFSKWFETHVSTEIPQATIYSRDLLCEGKVCKYYQYPISFIWVIVTKGNINLKVINKIPQTCLKVMQIILMTIR